MIVNGTTYHDSTPAEVINVLERFRSNRQARLRIIYGEVESGTPWGEGPEYYGNAESGYISRSGGRIQIPIILYNSRSYYGSGILDHCVVRIEMANKRNGGVLYDITR